MKNVKANAVNRSIENFVRDFSIYCLFLIVLSCLFQCRATEAQTGIITTVAGNGFNGFRGDGGLATNATLNLPEGVHADSNGNIFIADTENQRIRKVDGVTGIITTVAGNGDLGFSGDGGLATEASFGFPQGVSVDSMGNIFVADGDNARIRKVDGETGIITTVAGSGLDGLSGDGGLATNATLDEPTGVFVDNAGNIFIADEGASRIRKVDGATGIITTVAGNGLNGFNGDDRLATRATLDGPCGVFVDSKGNIFISDEGNSRIRKVDGTTSIITTVAGNGDFGFSGDGGAATEASLNGPAGVFVDSKGDIFITDTGNARIRKVDGTTGVITTVAGNGNFGFSGDGGLATEASLNVPFGMSVDLKGNFFTADSDNGRIRKVSFELETTPTLTDGVTLTVSPESLESSLMPKVVTVSALDQDGNPKAGVRIDATTNGRLVTVRPSSVNTSTDGTARFNVRFGFLVTNGEVVFTNGNNSVSVVQE